MYQQRSLGGMLSAGVLAMMLAMLLTPALSQTTDTKSPTFAGTMLR
jgi:hypothetical protein